MKFPQFLARSRLRSFLFKHKIAYKQVQLATNMFLLWLIRLLRRGMRFTRRYPYALFSVLLLGVIGLAIPADNERDTLITITSGSDSTVSCWMAENFRYEEKKIIDIIKSISSSRNIYAFIHRDSSGHGWHIPTKAEFENLITGAIIDTGMDTSELHADMQIFGYVNNNSDANCLVDDTNSYDFLESDLSIKNNSGCCPDVASNLRNDLDTTLDPYAVNYSPKSGTSMAAAWVSRKVVLHKTQNIGRISYGHFLGVKGVAGHGCSSARRVHIAEAYKRVFIDRGDSLCMTTLDTLTLRSNSLTGDIPSKLASLSNNSDTDSIYLVILHNNSDTPANWNWDNDQPIATWYGVTPVNQTIAFAEACNARLSYNLIGDAEFAGHGPQIAQAMRVAQAHKRQRLPFYHIFMDYGDGAYEIQPSFDAEASASKQGIHLHFTASEYSVHENQEDNNLAGIPVAVMAYGSGSAILFPPHATGITPLPPSEALISGALISPVLLSNTAGAKAMVNWLWILSITLVLLLVVLILLLWRHIRSRDTVFHPPKRQADSPLVIKDVMRLIARAELEQALTLLENTLEARNEDLLHEIILLQFQLHEIEREYRKNVITYEVNNCMKNRIASSTLALLTQLRAQPQLLGR